MTCTELAAVGLLFASLHTQPEFETFTPGVYAIADCGLTVAAFSNSEGNGTVFGGWTFEDTEAEFSLFATVGIATGYDVALVIPSGLVGVRWEWLKLGIAPSITADGNVGALVSLGIQIPF